MEHNYKQKYQSNHSIHSLELLQSASHKTIHSLYFESLHKYFLELLLIDLALAHC